MQIVPFLSLRQSAYKPIWDLQEKILAYDLEAKKKNRQGEPRETLNALFFCEHTPVYTLGKSGKIENLKTPISELQSKGIEYWHINRGGDITYHGPGQITGYPVFDLEKFKTSASWFIETIEDAVMDALTQFGITSQRIDGLTGIWIKGDQPEEDRKICAIGVKMSRWVSIHGFALNVGADLSYFDQIVPCGIDDKGVTSISKELGRTITIDEVEPVLKAAFEKHFNMQLEAQDIQWLEAQLSPDNSPL